MPDIREVVCIRDRQVYFEEMEQKEGSFLPAYYLGATDLTWPLFDYCTWSKWRGGGNHVAAL